MSLSNCYMMHLIVSLTLILEHLLLTVVISCPNDVTDSLFAFVHTSERIGVVSYLKFENINTIYLISNNYWTPTLCFYVFFNAHMGMFASWRCPNRGRTCNLFGVQDSSPTNWATRPGQGLPVFKVHKGTCPSLSISIPN